MTEPISRHARWRIANPEKVREQRKRYKSRLRGELPPFEKPPLKTEEEKLEAKRERMRRWHKSRRERMENDPEYAEKIKQASLARANRYFEKLKSDPVAYEAWLEKKRIQKRREKGIPLDLPARPRRLTDEQRAESKKREAIANRERKRRAYRIKHGIPLDAPIQSTFRGKPKKKVSEKFERANRSAMIAEIMARPIVKGSLTLAVCPDPPELQALFRRAAKGEPVRPYDARVKKKSVFTLRGYY